MKVKYTGIPLIILLLIGGGLKLCQTIFAANSMDFFLSADMTTLCVACCIVLMLVITIIFSLCDRKKSVVNHISKNIPAAIFGFVATVAILGTSALKVISLVTVGSDSIFGDILSIFIALFGGVVLLYENCMLFTGINKMKNFQLLTLCVPLWFCSRLVTMYAEYSTVAIRQTEIFDIVAVAFMAIFFYHQSVHFAELHEKRTPVKLFIFGMPMVLCSFIYTADMITKGILTNTWTDSAIVQYVGDIAVALYALCLMYGAVKSNISKQTQAKELKADVPSAEEIKEALEEKKPIIIQQIPEITSETISPKIEEPENSKKTENLTENDEAEKIVTLTEKPKPESEPTPIKKAEDTQLSEPNIRHAVVVERKSESTPPAQPTVSETPAENIVFTQKDVVTPPSGDEIDELLKELDD